MSRANDLQQALRQATEPEVVRDTALDLLAASVRRDYVDSALRKLDDPDVLQTFATSHQQSLRERALRVFDAASTDAGGLIREALTKLMIQTQVRHPDDAQVYRKGVQTYETEQGRDVTQNLRAKALVGLAEVLEADALPYAVKLLGEQETSELNGEPSMTAINLLADFKRPLPIYAFLLYHGDVFARGKLGELVGRGLETLGPDFPADLYALLAEELAEIDNPVVSGGMIAYITDHKRDALYPLLETVVLNTRSNDLHRYGLIAMANARDDALTATLYRLSNTSPPGQLENFIEAIELTFSDERDALLARLRKRLH